MSMFQTVQLTKVKALVSFNRLYNRYFQLMTTIDKYNTYLFIGGKFDLVSLETGEQESIVIPMNDTADYLRCYSVGSNDEIIWIKAIWDDNHNQILATERHQVIFTRETTYFLGLVV